MISWESSWAGEGRIEAPGEGVAVPARLDTRDAAVGSRRISAEVSPGVAVSAVGLISVGVVGCDGDGCVVVPAEVAEDVIRVAAKILVGDAKARRKLYDRMNMPHDETVDVEGMEEFYKAWL